MHAIPRVVPLLALLLALVAPAIAQDATVADLRRENEALRERIAQLEASLATLIEQNTTLLEETRALRREVEGLRDQLADAPPSEPNGAPSHPDAPALAPTPDDPMASPSTLLEALRRDHDDRFRELVLENPTQRERYLDELERWTRRIERDFTKRINWLIALENVEEIDREVGADARLTFRVLDPDSGLPYEDQSWSTVIEGRLAQRVLAFPDHERWRLGAICSAQPVINDTRDERGLVDLPPFIGTWTEFGYDLDVRAIGPVEDEDD